MRNIILGSDWWTDCDDVVAMRIICRAHRKKSICLKGIILNACMDLSVASLDGFLSSEKVKNIPIGLDRSATDFGGNPPYQANLAKLSGSRKNNMDAEDAVRLYRRLISESNGPVELLEIGFLHTIADTIESPPDEISPLSGMELFRQKVRKVWVMGGKWDENGGIENNFARNRRAIDGASRFCRLCPCPVTFLGWEVGNQVISANCLKHDDCLYRVLCDFGTPEGRKSWDPMLALMAVIGDEEAAGYQTVMGTSFVDPESGKGYFSVSETGRHCYVKMNKSSQSFQQEINEWIASV